MQPVVCLPGLLCTGAVYDRMREFPALAGARTVEPPALDDFGAISARIAAELPDLCVLVGHSMGAYLCLDLWRRAPRRIAGLVLLSCTPAADTPAQAEGRSKAVGWAAKAGMAALAGVIADQMLGPDQRADVVLRAQIRDMAQAVGHPGFAAHQMALAGRPDSTATLQTIACPVLAITGGADTVTPPDAGRALAAAVPDGRFHEIPGAGHMLPLEAPQALAGLIGPFLADCAAYGDEVLT